jgi:hypothetical protein
MGIYLIRRNLAPNGIFTCVHFAIPYIRRRRTTKSIAHQFQQLELSVTIFKETQKTLITFAQKKISTDRGRRLLSAIITSLFILYILIILKNIFINSSDTVLALKENAEITSARSAQVLMERAIRVENPEIVDKAPPMKENFKRIHNN